MRRFLGGGNASNGTPDQGVYAAGGVNGDPSADQKFLAELAMILAEEEEAKRLEAAKQPQQVVKDHEQHQEEVTDQEEQQQQKQPNPEQEQLNEQQASQFENLPSSPKKGLDMGMGYPQLGAGNIPPVAKPVDSVNPGGLDIAPSSNDSLESLGPIANSGGSTESNTDAAMNGKHDDISPNPTPVMDTNDDNEEEKERHPNNPLAGEEDNNNNNNAALPTTGAGETLSNEPPLPTREVNEIATASTSTNRTDESHDAENLIENTDSQAVSTASDSHPLAPEDTVHTQEVHDDPINLANDSIDNPPNNPLTHQQADDSDDQVIPTQALQEENPSRQGPTAPQQPMASSRNGQVDDKGEPSSEQYSTPISPTSVNLSSSTQVTRGETEAQPDLISNEDENVDNPGMQAQTHLDQSTEAAEGNSAVPGSVQTATEAHGALEVGEASLPTSNDVNSCHPATDDVVGDDDKNNLVQQSHENVPANSEVENDSKEEGSSSTIPLPLSGELDSPIQAKFDSDYHDEDTTESPKAVQAGLANNPTEEGDTGSPLSAGQPNRDCIDSSEIVDNGDGPLEPHEVRREAKTSLSTDTVSKDSPSKSAIVEDSDESTGKQPSLPMAEDTESNTIKRPSQPSPADGVSDDVAHFPDNDEKASQLETSPSRSSAIDEGESSDANTTKKRSDERMDGQQAQHAADSSPIVMGDFDYHVNGTDEVPGSRSDESAKKSTESGDQNIKNEVHGDKDQGQNEEPSLFAADKESLQTSPSEGAEAIPNASLEEPHTKTEVVTVEETQSTNTLPLEQLEVPGESSEGPSNKTSTENTSSIFRTKQASEPSHDEAPMEATLSIEELFSMDESEIFSMDESDVFQMDELSPTTTLAPEAQISDHQENPDPLSPEPESEIQNNETREEIESSPITEAVEHKMPMAPEQGMSSELGPNMPTVAMDIEPDSPESLIPTKDGEEAEADPCSSNNEALPTANLATDDDGDPEEDGTNNTQSSVVGVLEEGSTVQDTMRDDPNLDPNEEEEALNVPASAAESSELPASPGGVGADSKTVRESESLKIDVGAHVEEQVTVASSSSSDADTDGDLGGDAPHEEAGETKSEQVVSTGDVGVVQEEAGASKKDETSSSGAVDIKKVDESQPATATLEQKSPEEATLAAVVEQSEAQDQRLGQSNSSLSEKDGAVKTAQSQDDESKAAEAPDATPDSPSASIDNTESVPASADALAKEGEDENLTKKSTDDGQSLEPLKENLSHDTLFDDFEDIKSSFVRLLSATSSTAAIVSEATTPAIYLSAATVSEVTAPALAEAGIIMASSANAASGIIDTYRREIGRRRSERRRVVAFVQDDPSSNNNLENSSLRDEQTETDEFPAEDPAVLSVSLALAQDEVETTAVPTRLALSSTSDVNQYRTDVSSFLGDTPKQDDRENPDEANLQSLDPERLQGKFNAVNVSRYEDPILRAAVAGAERRNGYSQQEKQRRLRPRNEKHEFGASLKRFGDFTKATAASLANVALPAYEEAKTIAEGVTSSAGLHEQQEEEEVELLDSATGESLSIRGNSRNVFSASAVVLATRPLNQKGEEIFSNASHSTMHKEHASSRAGSQAASVHAPRNTEMSLENDVTASLSTAGNTLSAGLKSTLNDTTGKGWRDAKNAFENPSLVWKTVSERFHAIGTNEGRATKSASVFAHERKTASASSSISSPVSPVLSISSSSSSDSSGSQQNSLSTTSTAAKAVVETPQEVASYWDMVSTKKATGAMQTGAIEGTKSIDFRGNLQTPPSFVKKPDASSFDIISPLPTQVLQPYTPESSKGQHGTQQAIYNTSEGAEHLSFPSMETHDEHAEEGESNEVVDDSIIKPILKPRFSSEEKTSQDGPELPEEADPSMWEPVENSQEEPAPPQPLPEDEPKTSALSLQPEYVPNAIQPAFLKPLDRTTPVEKEQQADNVSGASQGIRSVQSADVGVEDADSVSQAGYLSLPSTQFTEDMSESMHTGSKRVRDRPSSTPGSASWGMNSLIGNSSFSGSKRSLLSSRRKSTSRRRSSVMNKKASKRLLFNDDSVSQFPALEELNTDEVQVATMRRSLSGADLLLLGNEEVFPDFDDASGGDGIGVVPDLALMACYSVANSDIFSELKKPVKSESLKYLASVRWRQVVSKWKHHYLSKVLLEKPSSSHFKLFDDYDQELSDDEDESTHSTGAQKEDSGWLAALRKSRQHCRIVSETKNLNGLMPHVADGEMRTLSRFLGALGVDGPESALCKRGSPEPKLAHILQKQAVAANASTLVKTAKANFKAFSDLVGNSVRFATNNDGGFIPEAPFSVGIKELEAIERKAKRKYGGDILQVKDILRAEIVFEDEGLLVSGLLNLFTQCSSSDKDKDGDLSFEIVRLKNLFFTGSNGMLCPSTLPTGYRHVLVNIRLNGLFLAEIQFQLSEVFDVLGYEGYTLHNEIVALDEACVYSFQNNQAAIKIVKKQEKGTPANMKLEKDNNSTSEPSTTKGAGMPTGKHGISESSSGDSNGEKLSNSEHATSSSGPDPTDSAPGSQAEGGDPTVDTALDEESGDKAASGKQPSQAESGDSTVDTALDEESGDKTASGKQLSDTSSAPADDDNSIVLFDSENQSAYLKNLRKSASTYSRDQLIDAVMAHAIKEANSMPRDVPTFFCFHLLLMLETGRISRDSEMWHLLFFDSMEWPLAGVSSLSDEGKQLDGSGSILGSNQSDDQGGKTGTDPRHRRLKASLQISKNCLLRCLAVSNQGTAVGMIGWLEYGADNAFGRFASSPFAALQELAYTFASAGDWHCAVDVLRAQITKCDQHLPLYHPCTLSSMIHLAGSARKVDRTSTDCRVVEEAASRLAFYLAEQEDLVLSKLVEPSGDRKSTADVLVFESTDSDGVSMLQAFVNSFEAQLSGRFIQLVGIDEAGKPNDIMNASHCFQGDAYSVLANCMAAREARIGVPPTDKTRTSQLYWRLAYKHYEMSFKGLLSNKRKLTDGSVVSAAHGMARCLRELGQRPQALQILSLIIVAFGREDIESQEESMAGDRVSENFASSFATIPSHEAYSRRFFTASSNGSTRRGKSRELMALCLWTMALLAVEEHKSERGRMRALSLLHSASEKLRPIVSTIRTPSVDTEKDADIQEEDPYARTLLRRIEQEAEKMLEPVEQAVSEAAPQQQQQFRHRAAGDHQGVLI